MRLDLLKTSEYSCAALPTKRAVLFTTSRPSCQAKLEMDITRPNLGFRAIKALYSIPAMVLLKKLAGIKIFKELEGKPINIGSGAVPDNQELGLFWKLCERVV